MEKEKKKNRVKLLLIALLLCAALICAAVTVVFYIGRTAELNGMQAGTYEGMPYRIYVPTSNPAQQKYPLVLYLHSAGPRGKDNRAQIEGNTLLEELFSEQGRTEYPCIVLAPQCPKNQAWVPGHEEGFPDNAEALMGLLEQVQADYPVDPARIYITGYSMGGFGTWGMLGLYPGYFAAAVPVCGGWLQPNDTANAELMKDTPIWAFHGALDTAVPVERTRDMVAALDAVGGHVQYTEYPKEEHSIAERVYSEAELLPWMFAQAKG